MPDSRTIWLQVFRRTLFPPDNNRTAAMALVPSGRVIDTRNDDSPAFHSVARFVPNREPAGGHRSIGTVTQNPASQKFEFLPILYGQNT